MYSQLYVQEGHVQAQRFHTKRFEPLQYLIAGRASAEALSRYVANLFRGRDGIVDETVSFDHSTETILHYLGESRFVSGIHMFPPVDLMIALSDSGVAFENQIVDNGIIVVDQSKVSATPSRVDLDKLIVPSWQLTRDLADPEHRETGADEELTNAAIFGVILSLHSAFFDSHEVERVLGSSERSSILVKAVRRGYDWAQEEKQLKGPLLFGNPGD